MLAHLVLAPDGVLIMDWHWMITESYRDRKGQP